MRPLVSIILPVFNRQDLVLRALESVFHQTFSSWECLVVDDGSTDATRQNVLCALEEFKTRNLPKQGGDFVFLSTEHRGVSHARNQGLKIARGEWIAFLDSDDVWFPNKLQNQFQFLEKHPHCKVLQSRETWVRKGKKVNIPQGFQKQEGDLWELSQDLCSITPSSVLMNKALLDKIGFFCEEMVACEDFELWLRLTWEVPFVGLVSTEDLIRYGGHPDQLSQRYPAMERFRVYAQGKFWNSLTREGRLDSRTRVLRSTLERRLSTLALGHRKRGKDADWIERILQCSQDRSLLPETLLFQLLEEERFREEK